MKLKIRSIRASDTTWEEWQKRAKAQGITVTDLIHENMDANVDLEKIAKANPLVPKEVRDAAAKSSEVYRDKMATKPHDFKCRCKACLRHMNG